LHIFYTDLNPIARVTFRLTRIDLVARRQRAEGRRQRAEDRGQKTEGRRQRAEGRRQYLVPSHM